LDYWNLDIIWNLVFGTWDLTFILRGTNMPTYEYECTSCKHTFEFQQKMSEKPIEKCPRCGAYIRRLIGPGSGIIFKGSGFYATDYKKKPSNVSCDKAGSSDKCPGCPGSEPKDKKR
jgi:putative FmdB family regulatory protein